jgi:endonuclease/exonuclease/phosphatase family metal-dependent hydrolase
MNRKLKLVTYNLRNGIKTKPLVKNIEKMAAQGANLFCFQEFRKFEKKPFVGEKMKDFLKNGWGMVHFLNENTFDLGLCIMWKKSDFDLLKTEKILLPKIPKLRKSLKVMEKVFFERSLPVQRGAIVAEFKIGHRFLRVVNVHLDWIGGTEHKAGQIQYLLKNLGAKSRTEYEIVCGDFNTVGPLGLLKKRRQKIIGALAGKFFDVTSGLRLTSRTFQKLDYIFSRGFKEAKAERLLLLGSDHMPLLAKFDF